jgi:hypothetical protein
LATRRDAQSAIPERFEKCEGGFGRQRQEQDRGAESHRLGFRDHPREQRHAVHVHEAVGEEVLARPHGREAELAGERDLLEVLAHCRGRCPGGCWPESSEAETQLPSQRPRVLR